MEEKIAKVKKEYIEITASLTDPKVIADLSLCQKLAKRQAEIRGLVESADLRNRYQEQLDENKGLLESETDADLLEMAALEIEELKEKIARLNKNIEVELLPKDPNDEKTAIVEIRAGAGGDESALFAADLFRMYTRFAERSGWKSELLSASENGIGGYKEIVFAVKGLNAYKFLKYESGVHRVQRVPETESGGRIHTSTATVAVLPEAKDVDIAINPNDLRIDVYRSGGCGGQSVNTTDSAVRITHLPTGIVVTCQDERSQLKNKDKAMAILRSRLLAQREEEESKKRGDERKGQIGTGDRSEKIRTYNFPQDRITDHRIGFSTHSLPDVLDGEIKVLLDRLIEADQESQLQNL